MIDNFDDGSIANPTIGGGITIPLGSGGVVNLGYVTAVELSAANEALQGTFLIEQPRAVGVDLEAVT